MKIGQLIGVLERLEKIVGPDFEIQKWDQEFEDFRSVSLGVTGSPWPDNFPQSTPRDPLPEKIKHIYF